MFIAALVTKAKRWKQSKCPSINEWISRKWDIHTIEYYSASKGKKILTHAVTRMNLENIMLCEISQSYKYKYCMFHSCEVSKGVKFHRKCKVER